MSPLAPLRDTARGSKPDSAATTAVSSDSEMSWRLAASRIAGAAASAGVFTGAGLIVGRAIVRDLFAPVEAQRVLSQVTLFFGVAPALAPLVGGLLHARARQPHTGRQLALAVRSRHRRDGGPVHVAHARLALVGLDGGLAAAGLGVGIPPAPLIKGILGQVPVAHRHSRQRLGSLAQLDACLDAWSVQLSPELLKAIDALVKAEGFEESRA